MKVESINVNDAIASFFSDGTTSDDSGIFLHYTLKQWVSRSTFWKHLINITLHLATGWTNERACCCSVRVVPFLRIKLNTWKRFATLAKIKPFTRSPIGPIPIVWDESCPAIRLRSTNKARTIGLDWANGTHWRRRCFIQWKVPHPSAKGIAWQRGVPWRAIEAPSPTLGKYWFWVVLLNFKNNFYSPETVLPTTMRCATSIWCTTSRTTNHCKWNTASAVVLHISTGTIRIPSSTTFQTTTQVTCKSWISLKPPHLQLQIICTERKKPKAESKTKHTSLYITNYIEIPV